MGRVRGLRTVAVVLASLGAAAGLSSVRAGDPVPFRLEERVGADTIAFAALEGFPTGWRTALRATSLGPLLDDEGLDGAIRPAFELLRRAFGRGGPSEAICAHFATALEGLDGQLAIAITGLRENGTPDVVVSLDFGARLSEFREFSSRVLETPPPGDAWTIEAWSHPGLSRARFTSGDTHWEAVVVGTLVMLDNIERPMNGSGLDPFLRPATDALAKLPSFVEAKGASPPGTANCFAYANLATLVSHALDDTYGLWSKAFVHAAGFDALTTLSYRAVVGKGGVAETLRLGASKGEGGIFSLFRTAPIAGTKSLPEPRRTWCHLETSLPVSTWPSRWRAFVHGIDAEDERDVVAGISRLDHVMGASLEGEVLAGLIDEQTLSIGLSDAGGAFPDVVLSIPLRDPAKFEPLFARAVAGLVADLSERGDARFAQRELVVGAHTMRVIASKGTGGSETPAFSPTWAVVGDRLVVTLVPHTMRAVFGRVDRADAAGSSSVHALASSPEVAAELSSARASGTACVVAVGDVMTRVYDTVVPLAETIPAWKDALEGVPLDAFRLPVPGDGTGTHAVSVLSLKVGPDGASFAATSPTGVLPTFFLMLAILDEAGRTDLSSSLDAPTTHAMSFASGADGDPAEATKRAIEQTIKLLREYQALHGSFPASFDDVLFVERLAPAIPEDGWRHALLYEPPKGTHPPRVTSSGADGAPGTGDDVVVDVELAPK